MSDDVVMAEAWFYPLKLGQKLATNEWVEWRLHDFLQSDLVGYATAQGWRAEAFTAVLLWTESYRQNPAGTLPDDDILLASLARCSLADWQAMRARALWGWSPCHIDDAPDAKRLGHPYIAEIARVSYRRKTGKAQGREAADISNTKHRVKKKLLEMKLARFAESDTVLDAVTAWLRASGLHVTPDNVKAALVEAAGVPRVVDGGFGARGV